VYYIKMRILDNYHLISNTTNYFHYFTFNCVRPYIVVYYIKMLILDNY